jgi:hypothetical protein
MSVKLAHTGSPRSPGSHTCPTHLFQLIPILWTQQVLEVPIMLGLLIPPFAVFLRVGIDVTTFGPIFIREGAAVVCNVLRELGHGLSTIVNRRGLQLWQT